MIICKFAAETIIIRAELDVHSFIAQEFV